MRRYQQPTSLAAALALRSEGAWSVLAGGTDFYPARLDRPVHEDVLDISRIDALRQIEEHTDHFRIGALVTWSQLVHARLPSYFEMLKLASLEVGGVQIQNRGTIVGNVCNASPAADGVPALLALNARVEVQSQSIPAAQFSLSEFIIGPRKTRLANDAMATALIIPKPFHAARSVFLKTGARKYLLISTAMVAAMVEHEGDTIVHARVAVGACSPVAMRLPALEARLRTVPLDSQLATHVQASDVEALCPIDDVRADAAYRRDVALNLVRRALAALTGAHA
jgi:CO/xanthine dehydrogenase FAD-binding subunit